MKPKILKLSVVALLFLFMGASCEKDELDYADESIIISSFPSLSVYKTRSDYFNNIAFQLTKDDKPNAVPAIPAGSSTKPKFRYLLKSGYVVDRSCSPRDVFTNISYKEYIDYNTEHGISSWPSDLLSPRIIDRDPYLEYYTFGGLGEPIIEFTLGEINDMIENSTIETVFEKVK